MKAVAATATRPYAGQIERTVAAGAFAATTLQFGGAALKYCAHVLFARWTDPQAFGLYAYTLAWSQVLCVVAGLGLIMGVLRFVPEYVASRDWGHLRGLLAWSRAVVFATGGLLGLAFAAAYAARGGAALWVTVGLVPFMACATLLAETLRALRRIVSAYAPSLVLQNVLAIGLAGAYVTTGGSIDAASALGIQAVAYGVIVGLQLVLVRNTVPACIHAAAARFAPKRWLKISLPLLAISVSVILLNQTDVIMVGMLRSTTEAGVYSAASRTAALVGLALVAANAVVAPMISEFFRAGRQDDLVRAVATGTRLALAGSTLTAAVLIVWGRDVLSWFGGGYAGGYAVVVVLALGHVVSAATGPVGYLLSLTGHERQAALIYAACAAIHVAMNLALVPMYGALGASLATAAAMVLWNVWLRVVVQSRLQIGGFLRGVPCP